MNPLQAPQGCDQEWLQKEFFKPNFKELFEVKTFKLVEKQKVRTVKNVLVNSNWKRLAGTPETKSSDFQDLKRKKTRSCQGAYFITEIWKTNTKAMRTFQTQILEK